MNAVLSECGRYRYMLERQWEREPRYVLWLMLNPSTADATKNDATIRRCIGYSKDWGYGGLLVGNLYAYRATDPRELKGAADPIGPDNDAWLRRLYVRASRVICAWGQSGPFGSRPHDVQTLLAPYPQIFPPPVCYLRLNASGEPSHPLRLPANLKPTRWPRWYA